MNLFNQIPSQSLQLQISSHGVLEVEHNENFGGWDKKSFLLGLPTLLNSSLRGKVVM